MFHFLGEIPSYFQGMDAGVHGSGAFGDVGGSGGWGCCVLIKSRFGLLFAVRGL